VNRISKENQKNGGENNPENILKILKKGGKIELGG